MSSQTFSFHASNVNIAQSVEIEFRLSAKVPALQRLISSSRLRLSLQWPGETKSYQLRELNRLNATLAQALRVRVNPEVTASNLFIYDVSMPKQICSFVILAFNGVSLI